MFRYSSVYISETARSYSKPLLNLKVTAQLFSKIIVLFYIPNMSSSGSTLLPTFVAASVLNFSLFILHKWVKNEKN